MRRWNKKVLGLAAAGVLLARTASVGKTYAYFTTYVQTAGTVAFQMGVTRTEIDEKVKDGKKIVSVKNTGDYDCYVRVTAFAGSDYTLTFADGGDGLWTDGEDGYWYYTGTISPQEATKTLTITIPQELFQNITDEKDLNVIVVQECAPACYGDDGALLPNGPERFAHQSKAGN